jgi:hypothetical protein
MVRSHDPESTARDIRDDPTDVGLSVGTTLDAGIHGEYRVQELLRQASADRTILYRAYVIRRPTADPHTGREIYLPQRVVLKLHSGRPLDVVFQLPYSPLLTVPALRIPPGAGVPGWIDVMPDCGSDLHRLWLDNAAEPQARRVTPELVLVLAIPMAAALVDAHTAVNDSAGYAHGDVKLSQFLLGDYGLQLTDWDHAQPFTHTGFREPSDGVADSTSVATTGWTEGYLPPWGRAGRSSPRYDAWALLVCLHMLLAGRHPAETYAGHGLSPYARADAMTRRQWRVEADIDEWWLGFLTRHMDESGTHRPTVRELLTELLQHAEENGGAFAMHWAEGAEQPVPLLAAPLGRFGPDRHLGRVSLFA